MEAVPRLPMVSFQLKVSPEPTCFATKLKQVCHSFILENPARTLWVSFESKTKTI